jgi:hypothetical protein
MPTQLITVDHGGDFFGVDTLSFHTLRDLAAYLPGTVPAADRGGLEQLLATPADCTIPPTIAAQFAGQLYRLAASTCTPRRLGPAARLLADAAARAAAAGKSWSWSTNTEPTRP